MRILAFGYAAGLVTMGLLGFVGCGDDDESDGSGSPQGGGVGEAGAPADGGASDSGGTPGTGGSGGTATGGKGSGEAGAAPTAGAPGSAGESSIGGESGTGTGGTGGGAAGADGVAGSESGGAAGDGSAGGSGGETATGLVELGAFSVAGKACGVGYDAAESTVWVYVCSSEDIEGYSTDGTLLESIEAPGEDANDVDVDVASVSFQLNDTELPAGTLLFTNGETDEADIYAVDASANAVPATLVTAFGNSHVVGGAYHADRATLFAVQDRVPPAANENLVAEISPETGEVLNVFSVLPEFDVNYGDIDVCQSTGNLFLVSSNETSIAEFTPEGSFVATYPLPAGVSSLSGLAIDDSSGEVWVSSTTRAISRLGGLPCP